jgi:hypothetical protein
MHRQQQQCMLLKPEIHQLLILTVENYRVCPLLDATRQLSGSELANMNMAILSAQASFNQNSVTSKANSEWSTALAAAPASITSSLYCSGYGGIDINSLPVWLASVPTPYVSVVLQEQVVYQSIIQSYVSEASADIDSSTATPAGSSVTPASYSPASGATLPLTSSTPLPTSTGISVTPSSTTSTRQSGTSTSLSWAPRLSTYAFNGALTAICLSLALAL